MNIRNLDALLGQLNQLLENPEMDSETTGRVLTSIYDELTKKFRPILRALPDLAPRVSQDLLPIMALFYELGIEMESDERLMIARKRFKEIVAKKRAEDVETYVNAGFSREEAMNILLQEMANQKAMFQRMTTNLKSSSSSSSSSD